MVTCCFNPNWNPKYFDCLLTDIQSYNIPKIPFCRTSPFYWPNGCFPYVQPALLCHFFSEAYTPLAASQPKLPYSQPPQLGTGFDQSAVNNENFNSK
jgi:hypothetical protein